MTQGDTGSAAPTGRASAISVHRVRYPATGSDDGPYVRFAGPALAAARHTISLFDDGAVPTGAGVAGGDDFSVVVVATEPGLIADLGLRDRCAAWMACDLPDGAAPPVVVTHRGAELTWRPGRAILVCAAEQVELLMPGIVEFTYYDLMLRRLESGVAGAWADLRRDTRLTHAVARADLLDAAAAGRRRKRHSIGGSRWRRSSRTSRRPIPACPRWHRRSVRCFASHATRTTASRRWTDSWKCSSTCTK